MSDGLAERIRQCADIAGSGDELARITSIPRRTLEYYLTGKSEPKIGRCVEIAKAVGVDIAWLATGEGEQRLNNGTQVTQGEVFAYIPLYDSRCAVEPGARRESVRLKGQLAFPAASFDQRGLDAADLAAIRVDGDSMEAMLSDGDTVVFDSGRNVLEGEAVYVIRLEDHLYAKRLQRQFDGSVHVISENKSYRDLVVPKERLGDLQILGRVVWSGEWML